MLEERVENQNLGQSLHLQRQDNISVLWQGGGHLRVELVCPSWFPTLTTPKSFLILNPKSQAYVDRNLRIYFTYPQPHRAVDSISFASISTRKSSHAKGHFPCYYFNQWKWKRNLHTNWETQQDNLHKYSFVNFKSLHRKTIHLPHLAAAGKRVLARKKK